MKKKKMRCWFCGIMFEYLASIKNRKYCSRKCQHISLKGKTLSEKHKKKISNGVKNSDKYYSGLKKRPKVNNSGTFVKGDKRLMGKNHPSWNGGEQKTSTGYIYEYASNHPNSVKGYVFQHRLIMEKNIGRLLKVDEVVHHKNGIVDDNTIENLRLFNSQSNHMKHHKGGLL